MSNTKQPMSEEKKKIKKWFKYTIDYEYGTATVLSKQRLNSGIGIFYLLAGDCFGIRKSIGKTELIDEELVNFDGKYKTDKNSGKQIMKIGMGDYSNTMLHAMLNRETEINIPMEKLDKIAYILAHSGDVIVFSDTDFKGRKWKLKSEWGDWCICDKEGKPKSSCKVHGD